MSDFDTTLAGLGINRTGSAATPPVAPVGSSSDTLGQADFLKLLTAQLQNQDPFDPVDNTQMVSQMAQFSQLSGITDMNATLTTIANKLTGTSTSDAMSYVGKTVLVPGDTAYGLTTGGMNGSVNLGGDADDLKVSISDSNGNLLKTMDLGKQSQGQVDFSWDGKTDAGADAGSGPFKISAIANASGKTVDAQTLVWAPVSSVSNPGSGTPVLNVAGVGAVDLSDVVQIG
jgi:flagellar basal-body rod modification protein FlgD